MAAAPAYLGALGGMGLTAYAGLIDAAQLQSGDVVWVSAAAGAVGSLAAQIAKLRGHRVIGSAGSDTKVRHLLEDLGLDAAFNYRSGPVVELLREAAPEGIDVYFDSVGGDHLEAALDCLRRRGRVALCGALSEYEADGPNAGPRNLFQATANDLTLRGFRGSSHLHRMDEVTRELGGGWPKAACTTARRSSTGSSARRRRSCGCWPARRWARRWCASGRDRFLAVAARLTPGDRHVVHLVGPVGDLQDAGDGVELGQQRVLADAHAAVGLDGAVDDPGRPPRARRP